MDKRGWLVAALAALVVVLAGAVMYLSGRMGAEGDTPSATNAAAAPAASDSSTGGKDPLPTPSIEAAQPMAPPVPAAPPQDPHTIPAAFHGEWNAQLEHCGTGLNDSAMRIEPRVMRFYESRGDVIRVTRNGERSVSVEANFQGEGETWTETVRLTLSPEDGRLTTGEDAPRLRCG
jgi:hypothetical protein